MTEQYKVCDACRGKMRPRTVSRTFRVKGKNVTLDAVNAYRCDGCGKLVFDADEVKRIERLLHEKGKEEVS